MERPIEVRACRPADVPAVLGLWRVADAEPVIGEDVRSLRALIRHRNTALLVATQGEQILGTLIAAFDGWRGNLYRLAVLPDYRRHGVASRLVEAGEARLRGRGARRISAVVIGENRPARAFWRAAGYELNAGRVRYVKNIAARGAR